MPVLKWAGGKGQLLPELLARLPRKFHGYHEPFFGGGALFFALSRQGLLRGRRASLADLNAELVLTYGAVRDEPDRVIEQLASHKLQYGPKFFYELRKRNWQELSRAEAAARMIFLNRTGYNGLYRVNSKGEFNVPFGRYKNPRICDAENLRAASHALQAATLHRSSFEEVARRARKGDLVYFDPPYVPLSSTANFVAYTSMGFSMKDQEKLADLFDDLAGRGVLVMLSNSSDTWVLERYERYSVSRVLARRRVNSRADRRGPVAEVIVTSYPVEPREEG